MVQMDASHGLALKWSPPVDDYKVRRSFANLTFNRQPEWRLCLMIVSVVLKLCSTLSTHNDEFHFSHFLINRIMTESLITLSPAHIY